MSILTRYICRRLIIYYFAFVGMMAVFFVFVDFMEHIEIVSRHHAPAGLIALYYACLLPKVFVETSWVGFLVSTLFVLGSLAKKCREPCFGPMR
jgi:lipopolysaccharide export LptBFGC system permease protein LptF